MGSYRHSEQWAVMCCHSASTLQSCSPLCWECPPLSTTITAIRLQNLLQSSQTTTLSPLIPNSPCPHQSPQPFPLCEFVTSILASTAGDCGGDVSKFGSHWMRHSPGSPSRPGNTVHCMDWERAIPGKLSSAGPLFIPSLRFLSTPTDLAGGSFLCVFTERSW